MTAEPSAGSPAVSAWAPIIAWVDASTGGRSRTVVLGGSHASGEAVWAEWDGARRSLSDLDLYVVLPGSEAANRLRASVRSERERLASLARSCGLAAPIEIGGLSETAWRHLPARPATLELARCGRVLAGDPGMLDRLPHLQASDVGDEERLLLLENRGPELLKAWSGIHHADGWERLRARHATFKAAIDFASVLAIAEGRWPAGAEERIAWARGFLARDAGPLGASGMAAPLGRLWDDAVRWRREPRLDPETVARDDWFATVRLWCAFWDRFAPGAGEPDPWRRALRAASRARLRRRARLAFSPEPREGAPAWPVRLRYLWAGTTQHRVLASAAILLRSAALGGGEPALSAGALRSLASLGVSRASAWDEARRAVFDAWSRSVLGDRRAEPTT